MVLDENFREFLKSLNENGVKYLVVGGYADAFHGYPRYTKDLDFWIWASPDNAEKVIRAIQDFSASTLGLKAEDFLDTNNVIQIGREPNRIDLITDLEGMDFEACFEKRQEAVFEGIELNFIHFEGLIQSKKASGRLKDLADVEALEKRLRKKK
jgi:predicted nucleotidyltransferase